MLIVDLTFFHQIKIIIHILYYNIIASFLRNRNMSGYQEIKTLFGIFIKINICEPKLPYRSKKN